MVMKENVRKGLGKFALALQIGLCGWAVVADPSYFVPARGDGSPQTDVTLVQRLTGFVEAELLLMAIVLILFVMIGLVRLLSVDGSAYLLAAATLILGYVAITTAPAPLAAAVLVANPILIWSLAAKQGRTLFRRNRRPSPRYPDGRGPQGYPDMRATQPYPQVRPPQRYPQDRPTLPLPQSRPTRRNRDNRRRS